MTTEEYIKEWEAAKQNLAKAKENYLAAIDYLQNCLETGYECMENRSMISLPKTLMWDAESTKKRVMTAKIKKYPDSIKNNNPLNILCSQELRSTWPLGDVERNGDLYVFESRNHGFRAGLFLLRYYYYEQGCDTIAKLVERWPSARAKSAREKSETIDYVNVVISRYFPGISELNADSPLPPEKWNINIFFIGLAWAICSVENYIWEDPDQDGPHDVQLLYKDLTKAFDDINFLSYNKNK